jgi:multidrug resistance protein, MATE family
MLNFVVRGTYFVAKGEKSLFGRTAIFSKILHNKPPCRLHCTKKFATFVPSKFTGINHMSSQYYTQRLLNGGAFRKELRLTLALALPLMLGELSSMLMGVAGTMMTGHLGETALAASGVASVIYVMAMLLIWGGVRMIPTPVAEAHELRDGDKMRTLVLAGALLSVFFWVVCSVLLWLGIRNFDLLQQDPDVARLAVDYLRIIIFCLPVMVLFGILINYVDAFGFVRLTMFLAIGGLFVDVLLNWLFIFGHFGLPRLGLNAIAMNTGITHFLMTLVLLVVVWKHPELAYFRAASTTWDKVVAQTKTFIRTGIPSALQVMVEFAAFAAGTVLVGQISKTEQAAHQIAINLIGVTYVTIMGVSTAGMIRVGQALAYQSKVKIWIAGVACITLAMSFMLLPTAAFLLLPGQIVGWYIEEPQVAGLAVTLLFFAAMFQLADAAQASSISLLRAMNDVKIPSLLSFIAFWLVGLPIGYWLAFVQGWNAKGIWVGYLIALLIQAALFTRRFFTIVKRYSGKKETTALTENSVDGAPLN